MSRKHTQYKVGGGYLITCHLNTMNRKYSASRNKQTHLTNYSFSRKSFNGLVTPCSRRAALGVWLCLLTVSGCNESGDILPQRWSAVFIAHLLFCSLRPEINAKFIIVCYIPGISIYICMNIAAEY